MTIPVQITIRDEEHAKYLSRYITEKATKLQQFSHDIIRARIVVDMDHHNRQQGNLHTVHIELTIPQDEIVINKVADENVYIAIRDALNAACRQLQNTRKKKLIRRRSNSIE